MTKHDIYIETINLYADELITRARMEKIKGNINDEALSFIINKLDEIHNTMIDIKTAFCGFVPEEHYNSEIDSDFDDIE